MQVIVNERPTQRVPIKAWTDGVEFDNNAREQLLNLASLPFVYKHVAVLPDVHFGLGATVGTVFASKGAVIPAAVGVDIGCGMIAARLTMKSADVPDKLAGIRWEIERAVPAGEGGRGSWENIPLNVTKAYLQGHTRLEAILAKHPKIIRKPEVAAHQTGSLGGGNHFIELSLEVDAAGQVLADGHVWLVLHSGSRGIGNAIGRYFTDVARVESAKWQIQLPDKDLAYLPEHTVLYDDYMEALLWAQEYALVNRNVMLSNILERLTANTPHEWQVEGQAVSCHHNYVELENHFGSNVLVTRKGAVRARQGDLGVIPGSMGTRSYIVRGKGNPDSFNSCAHGAGRRLSRSAAKQQITVADHELATAGVECRKDAGVLDESPAAYKDIDNVMAAQADLVDVVHILKGVLCVKG